MSEVHGVPESDMTERLTYRYVCINQATSTVRIHCGFTVATAVTELPGTSQACCFRFGNLGQDFLNF